MIREDRRMTQDGNRSISISFVALDPVLQGVLIIGALQGYFVSRLILLQYSCVI